MAVALISDKVSDIDFYLAWGMAFDVVSDTELYVVAYILADDTS